VIVQRRERELAHRALRYAVELMSFSQVSTLWGTDIANVRRRLKMLETKRHLEVRSLLVYEPPNVAAPLCSWNVGDPPITDFGPVSYIAKSRLKSLAIRRTLVVCAPGTRVKQASHALGLTQIYLQHPWKNEFLGEHAFPESLRGFRMKVPDALVCEKLNPARPKFAVDYVNHYHVQRLQTLADALVERNISYRFF